MGDVLFLGDTFYSDPNLPEQTWVWNGSGCIQLHLAHEPSIRSNAAIACDPATKQVVLFGGPGLFGLPEKPWRLNDNRLTITFMIS